MNTVGVVLLAAATATSGFGIGKPHVGGKRFLRHHAAIHGAPPAGGMIDPSTMGPGAGPGMAGAAMAGADAAGGASGAGRRFPNTRSQIFFVDPTGMQIGWQTAANNGDRVYLPAQLTAPARYNFQQGYIYRLKITNLGPGRESLSLYPTLEVAPSTPETDAYLTHNPIPVQFTEEDFDQVQAGNFVTKVIYLPDPRYQELAVAGVETLVSTRLDPGVNPVLEADKRGTILMIVRLGGIDLEMQQAGSATITPSDTAAPLGPQPGAFIPPVGTTLPSEVLDTGAPVAPATTNPGIIQPNTAPVGNEPPAPAAGDTTVPPTPDPTVPAPGNEPQGGNTPGLLPPGGY